ncbi:MAG: ABC transporter permease subunit [Bdellovibrionales bacterium]|nr:ABC transporter permease subunit [Bdellovibrionales bacterium]
MKGFSRNLTSFFLALLALAPSAAIFVFPLFSLFTDGLQFRQDGFWSGLVDPVLLSKVRFTLYQAGISAVLSGLIGLPLGLILRNSPRASSWLRLPFGVPSLVAAVAWVSILSSSSIRYSFSAVVVAHVFFNVPWIAYAVSSAAASIPQGWEDLARSLGAPRIQRWKVVSFPILAPAWISSCVQAFVFCSMSFALVLILGGGPPVETLETAIYSSVRMGSLDLMMAARLAFWQLLICLAPWVLTRFLWTEVELKGSLVGPLKREPLWHHILGLVWILPYFVFFKDLDWSVIQSAAFWSAVRDPLLLSLQLSVLVAVFSVSWAGLAIGALMSFRQKQYQKLFELFLLMPSGVSTLTISMGFWMAYAHWVDPFEGSVLALTLIQGVVFFPVVFRILLPLFRNRSLSLIHLAKSLGASSFRAWREVEWPRLRAPVLHCLALVSAASLGELSAVSFFSSEKIQTLPLLVSQSMAQYRFDYAHAISALLFVTSAGIALGFQVGRSR